MNQLNYLWALIETNSGQLQTILTLIGLVFAFIAAKYAKKQIMYAKDQIKIANDQQAESLRLTAYNLKLSILTTAFECKELIHSAMHKHKKLKETFASAITKAGFKMENTMPGYDFTFEEYLSRPIELLNNPKDIVEKLIKQISDLERSLDHKDLELYLHTLIKIKGSINSANEGYDRRIEEFQEIIKP